MRLKYAVHALVGLSSESSFAQSVVTVRVHRQQMISSITNGMTSQVPEDCGRLTLTSDQTILNRVCRAQQKSCPDTRLLSEMVGGAGSEGGKLQRAKSSVVL